MTDTRPVPQFRCEEIEKSKLFREWNDWKSGLERYFDANEITDQYKKRAKLLYLGGPQLDKVFSNLPDANRFPVVATEKKYYDVAIVALNNYFQPVKQDILERYHLRQMKQMPNEKFAHYMVINLGKLDFIKGIIICNVIGSSATSSIIVWIRQISKTNEADLDGVDDHGRYCGGLYFRRASSAYVVERPNT